MADRLIFITTHTIHAGALESIKDLSKTFTELVAASDTGLVAFHFYINDDGTEVSNVQVHADAAPMDAYLPVVREKISEALDLSETNSIDVFGTPGPVLREVLRQNEQQGVLVRVKRNHLDGFTRWAPA